MLLLATTLDKIQVVTTGSANVDVHASYIDWDGKVSTPGRKNTAIASATTTDVVLAPATGVSRSVGLLNIRNTHASLSNGVTVQHTDGTIVVILKDLVYSTMTAGEEFVFSDSQGWQRFARNGALYTSARTVYSFQPANPASTSSATKVMMGLGSTCQVTTTYSNRLYVKVTGILYLTVYEAAGISLMFGTGTPPANGVASTGTSANDKYVQQPPMYAPFALSAIISGLTTNTVYWLDIAINSSGGHSMLIANVQIVVFET
jgi:hypothetical protein